MGTVDKSTKRSWPWGVRIVLLLLGAGLFGAGIVFFLEVAATARWDRYATALRAGGNPLTFDEVQAARAVIPDEKNGALVIVRLHDRLEELSEAPAGEGVLVFSGHGYESDFFTGIRRDTIQPSRDFLEPYRDLLAELSVLRDMPTGRFEVTYDPTAQSIASIVLPNLDNLRAASKLEFLHGILEHLDGNLAGAVDSARVQLAFGATLDEHPTVIGRLLQGAVDARGVGAMENLLRVGELDDVTLLEFAQTLHRRRAAATMRWALLGERAYFSGICDEYVESAQSRDRVNSIIWGGYSDILPDALIRGNQMRGVEMFTWLVDARNDPAELVAAAQRINTEAPKLTVMHGLVRIIMPSLSRAVTLHLRISAQLDCTIAGLAAERYRFETGKLPESLDALVPTYLDEVPTDPFDGEPMRFTQTNEGIVIYSVSDDLADDGGIVSKQKDKPRYRDIGFRLNRAEHRGLILVDAPPSEEED